MPIGDNFADRLAPNLLTDDEVCIELGLSPVAVQRAVKHPNPLQQWVSPVGAIFWRREVNAWAFRTIRVHPLNLDSRARLLCAELGMNEDEGLLVCDVCSERGVRPNRVALRRCAKCGRSICNGVVCGDYFVPPGHDARYALPVVCSECRKTHPRLVTLGSHGFGFPGIGQTATQLALRYQALVDSNVGRELRKAFRSEVQQHLDYFQLHVDAIRKYLEAEIKPPPGFPDVFANLRAARDQLEEEIRAVLRLTERIDQDLS